MHFGGFFVSVERNHMLFLRLSFVEPELPQSHCNASGDLLPGYRERDQPQTHEQLKHADLLERLVEHHGPGCATRNSRHFDLLHLASRLSKREKLQENHHHAEFPDNRECRQNEKTRQVGHGFCRRFDHHDGYFDGLTFEYHEKYLNHEKNRENELTNL